MWKKHPGNFRRKADFWANKQAGFIAMQIKALAFFCLCGLHTGCDSASAPLDAATRQRIDSTATAQIRQTRLELDSLCAVQRSTELPRLVDSIKQKREEEIARQLQTVPK
jgi:hypothetical protein